MEMMEAFNMAVIPHFKTFTIIVLILTQSLSAEGFRFNGSCGSNIECLPRETFMRCTKGKCICAADSEYDFRNAYCRLKINVKCYLTGHSLQPCVRGAFCDPPAFADGSKIHGASTGNCKCYQGESIEEDGTCSGANSLQRSFGNSILTGASTLHMVLIVASLCLTVIA